MTKKFVPADIPQYLSAMNETSIRLAEISERRDDAELAKARLEGEWSILQILAHICACQDVWAYSIYVMLSVDDPELFPLHPRQMAATMNYDALSFTDLFFHFRSGRKELLRILNNLSEAKWQRKAIINGRQHSVFSQVRRMAIHESDHWLQIDKALE
jgi:hypothetical protein